MSDFSEAFQLLMQCEGGWVNVSYDKGGATNYGITQETLSNYLKKPITKDDVKRLTICMAQDIYKCDYWLAAQLDQVKNTKLCSIIFNLCVLRGLGTVIKDIQFLGGLKGDGIIGYKTLEALNLKDPTKMAYSLIKMSQIAFVKFCQRDPVQLAFLPGWLNRSHLLLDYLNDYK